MGTSGGRPISGESGCRQLTASHICRRGDQGDVRRGDLPRRLHRFASQPEGWRPGPDAAHRARRVAQSPRGVDSSPARRPPRTDRLLQDVVMVDGSGQPWEPDWPRCAADICIGARVEGHDWCLAHLDDRGLADVLAGLRPQANIDARGTAFTEELLDRLLASVKDADGVPMLGGARFDRAFFDGHARFQGGFFGAATFRGAEFRGDTTFVGSRFWAAAVFTEARFRGWAKFDGVRFATVTEFDRAEFSRDAEFMHTSFDGLTHFGGAQFEGGASFPGAKFAQATWFSAARFGGVQRSENGPVESADFATSEVLGRVVVHMAIFDGDVT